MVDIEVDQTLKNDTEVSRQEVIDTKVDKKNHKLILKSVKSSNKRSVTPNSKLQN